jgi:hypothetical protein
MYSVASIFTMLYKPRMTEVAGVLGAKGDDRDMPFGWAMRVSETGEVRCREVLEKLTDEELRRVAALWQLQGWERVSRVQLIDALCARAGGHPARAVEGSTRLA